MSLPQSLMFTVGLVDQITKPIAKISKGLNGLTNDYQAGTMKMASGAAGIAGAGFALQNALMPAIEMDRALGEVKSLGVRESALKQLTDTSYEFALKYGQSSTEFVKSSYDIQSAIAGLNDADLSAFTLSGNVLAAATKADAATITDYMGTMYATFKNEAESMGKGEWVQQLTGMTATAVQVFKTDGKKMADAFKGMSGASKEALSDQMAILGTLQSTLGGGESATQYKAFLGGAAKAQEKLGMNFTDQYGKLLPTIEILEKLKGKYGDLTIASDRLEIKEAFGTDQALGFIDLLTKDTDALRVNMDALGKVKGMEQAEKMASAMTDQSERLSQSWYVIRAAWGSVILPVFNDFVGLIADMGTSVVAFTEEFPTLTKYIGYAAVGVLGLVAAGGLFTLIMGAGKMAMVAWAVGGKVATAALWLFGLEAKKSTAAMFGLNIVMAANPIGLIVLGIVAAIAAVGALIYYWDDLKATMGEWGWIKAIGGIFSSVWGGIKSIFNDTMDWIIDKLNMIPGVDIEVTPEIAPIDKTVPENVKTPAPLMQYEQQAVPNNVVPFAQPAVPENVKTPAPLMQYEQQAVPNNVVPFAQPAVPENVKTPAPLMQYEQQAVPNNVVPFAQPAVPENVKTPAPLMQYDQQTVPNNVVPFAQPAVPENVKTPAPLIPYEQQVTPNNVVPFSPPVMPENFVLEAQQTEQLKSKPPSYNELPALKLERMQPQQSITNARNTNSNDNSKRVYIENVTMKSDDIARDFERMMELTG